MSRCQDLMARFNEIKAPVNDTGEFKFTYKDISAITKEFMPKFFKDMKYPYNIRIVNYPSANWLGGSRVEGKRGYPDTYKLGIEIQKRIADMRTLRRVVVHELIHGYDFWKNKDIPLEHGPLFTEYMNKINKKYGKDFITIYTDKSYKEKKKNLIG